MEVIVVMSITMGEGRERELSQNLDNDASPGLLNPQSWQRMSKEWIIDPQTLDSAHESQYHWVIKGTNQLLQSIDVLLASHDADGEATIEFTSRNEALIVLGDRQFYLSRQPVDFLELYSSQRADSHLKYQGNAGGRFLVSTAGSDNRDDGPMAKRPRKEHPQSRALPGPKVTIIDPTSLFENVDFHEDIVVASSGADKGAMRPVATTHGSKNDGDRNQRRSQQPTSIAHNTKAREYDSAWIRVDDIPFGQDGRVIAPDATVTLVKFLKRIFQDLTITAISPNVLASTRPSNHSTNSDESSYTSMSVYVRLSSTAAAALALKHPSLPLSSIVAVAKLPSAVSTATIRLSAVRSIESYCVECLLPLMHLTASSTERETDTHRSHMWNEQDLAAVTCVLKPLREDINDINFNDPAELAKLLCQEYCNRLRVPEAHAIQQLQSLRRRVTSTVYANAMASTIPTTIASTSEAVIALESISSRLEKAIEMMASMCADWSASSMDSTTVVNEKLMALAPQWVQFLQDVRVLIRRSKIRLNQVDTFVSHYDS